MQVSLRIKNIQTINTIPDYWKTADYLQLLELFDFSGADESEVSELPELLDMAINDFEPDEAAAIILKYKLEDKLSEGQIQNLSHEMQDDKVAEEYADISLHYDLYNVNQLLHKAYNGKFPNTKASKVDIIIDTEMEVTREVILKGVHQGLTSNNLIVRLFEDQLLGSKPFPEAENIIWELKNIGTNEYCFITSDYWLNKEDIAEVEFDGKISLHVEAEE